MSRSRNAWQGMTLTEVVVYCTLLSIFSLMLFINLPTRSDVNSEDLRVATAKADDMLERLTLELGNSSATSVSSLLSPTGVRFLSASEDGFSNFSYTNDGQIAWLGWVGYFWHEQRISRVWYPFKSPMARSSIASAPSYAEMMAGGSQRIVCERVSNFAITSPETGLWQFQVELLVGQSRAALVSGAGARN